MTRVVDWFADQRIDILPLLGSIAVLFSAWLIILMLGNAARRWLQRVQTRLPLDYETTLLLSRIFTWTLWLVAIFIIFSLWGIGLGGVWTVLVSVIAVIGIGFLATWAMISNFTAHFFLLLWRPFHFGQIVEILPENVKGRVTDRNLAFTTLAEDNGTVVQVPNNLFFQKMFRVSDQSRPMPEV